MTSEGELADSAAPRRDLIHAVTVGLVGLGGRLGRDTGLALGGAAVGIRLLGNVVLALVARRAASARERARTVMIWARKITAATAAAITTVSRSLCTLKIVNGTRIARSRMIVIAGSHGFASISSRR